MTVTLVPLAREHLAAVEELIRDPDVLRFTRVPAPPPPGFAETWLGLYERGGTDGTRKGFAVVDGTASSSAWRSQPGSTARRGPPSSATSWPRRRAGEASPRRPFAS